MPLSHDQALFLRDNAIRNLKMEQPVTQRVIEAIPLDKGDYRPEPSGKSALELARHIAGAEHLFHESVITGAFDFANASRLSDLNTSADVARWYAETSQRDLARLIALPA